MKVLGFVATLLFLSSLTACEQQTQARWQGYVEGETLFLAAPVAGTLGEVSVREGEQLESGAKLFVLDEQPESQALANAKAQLKAATAEFADLQKGRRPEEIQVIEAQYAQAKAAAELSDQQLQRTRSLVQRKLASEEALDEIITQAEKDKKRLDEMSAQLETAKLAARSDQQQVAAARVEAAQANLDLAQWQVNEKTQYAPTAARVEDILYRPGEFVPAGRPVIAILPQDQVKIRFFVPQNQLTKIRENKTVSIHCDGCEKTIPATIRFISSQVEYTPPFIYSKENRAKFVFLVEAWPDADGARLLHPGQPVDVMLLSAVNEQ